MYYELRKQAVFLGYMKTRVCSYFTLSLSTVDIKSLHIPVKISSLCDVKKLDQDK